MFDFPMENLNLARNNRFTQSLLRQARNRQAVKKPILLSKTSDNSTQEFKYKAFNGSLFLGCNFSLIEIVF